MLGLEWKGQWLGFRSAGLTRLVTKKPNNLLKDHEHQGSEALLYPLEEYMKYVEEWFRCVHPALKWLQLADVEFMISKSG